MLSRKPASSSLGFKFSRPCTPRIIATWRQDFDRFGYFMPYGVFCGGWLEMLVVLGSDLGSPQAWQLSQEALILGVRYFTRIRSYRSDSDARAMPQPQRHPVPRVHPDSPQGGATPQRVELPGLCSVSVCITLPLMVASPWLKLGNRRPNETSLPCEPARRHVGTPPHPVWNSALLTASSPGGKGLRLHSPWPKTGGCDVHRFAIRALDSYFSRRVSRC